MTPQKLLEVRDLAKHYEVARGVLGGNATRVEALRGVSFDVGVGETVSLVGESGSGKTTVARTLLRLTEPSAGSASFHPRDGSAPVDLFRLRGRALRRVRAELGLVFQDPFGSLNPRMPVGETVVEGLRAHERLGRRELAERARALLDEVGLPREAARRYPHEFSGGQRQRIGIARALATRPRLVVLDEAVSALDVSVQAQVLNLLQALQERLGLAYLFITHDLSVVRHVSDRICVLRDGSLVEEGLAEDVLERPQHAYTRALLEATPSVPGAPGRTET